jgi:toxin ParE1/3/4
MPEAKPRELRLTPKAEDDLEDIWSYTAETWSANQADRYLDELLEKFDLLLAMPEIAHERTEFTPPVRIHPSGSHLLVYRIEVDHLLIIRVLGARQNWQIILDKIDL